MLRIGLGLLVSKDAASSVTRDGLPLYSVWPFDIVLTADEDLLEPRVSSSRLVECLSMRWKF